ncbi:hypothetical protein V501_10345 [Pseudogymnoascus sp. VKM F-4519 (FW-2642)]|nr:hypothetical protein V501_10345 [Pseudogymnoascus sp. VKM F-4519 (FW-2642)]
MPTITLCRFGDGKQLSLHEVTLESSSYIAISHIWAQASWTKIPGIAEKVLVSPQKARFIQDRLPALVGHSLFWMDVLVVDQSSKDARLAVVEHIPAVYMNATKTIVVREDGGFGPCCESLLDLIDDEKWNVTRVRGANGQLEDYDIASNAAKHLKSHHQHGLYEIWSHRLWPLQETNLSQTIQFTVCENAKRAKSSVTWGKAYLELTELDKVAEGWVERGQFIWPVGEGENPDEQEQTMILKKEFMRAMLNNGTVTRSSEPVPEGKASVFHTLVGSLTSSRETTKARDFVLALFPSYSWYTIPPNVRDMKFGELWVDCVTQFQTFHEEPFLNLSVKPKLTLGVLGHTELSAEESQKPSADIPYPRCLGDFARLAYFLDSREPYLDASRRGTWRIQKMTELDDLNVILAIVSETVYRTRIFIFHEWISQYSLWATQQKSSDEQLLFKLRLKAMARAVAGRSDKASDESDDTIRRLEYELAVLGDKGAAKCFAAIIGMYVRLNRELDERTQIPRVAKASWDQIVELAKEHDTPSWRTSLLHLAATVSCGLGFSSLSWSRDRLSPYLASYHEDGQRNALIQTLMIASPNLTIHRSDEINLFTNPHDPYVVKKSTEENGAPKVIGAAIEWHHEDRDDFKIVLYNGCPLALPCNDPGSTPDEWICLFTHGDYNEAIRSLMGSPGVSRAANLPFLIL